MKKNNYSMPATRNKSSKGVRFYLTHIVWWTNIVVLILLFLSCLAWYVSPAKAIVLAYLGMGFPFIVILNICYLILWLFFQKWKLGVISFIAILLCGNPISIYFPIHFRSKTIPNDCIKLLTYNVSVFNFNISSKNPEENKTLLYIKNSNADIICIQEFMALNNQTTANIEGIHKILKNYPYYSIINLHPLIKSYTFGIACFSKYPILSTSKLPLDAKDNGSVLYKLQIKNKKIALIVNHLESNRITSSDKYLYSRFFHERGVDNFQLVAKNIRSRLGIAFETRCHQADLVSKCINEQEKSSDGVIVCGDFNDTPISYTYHTVKSNLIDSYASTGNGPGITFNANHFFFRIDYIMHSKNIKSFNTTVGQVKYSDHYPVWTYLELPK